METGFKNERWVARVNGIAIDVIEEKSGFGIVHIGSDKELKDCDYPKDRAIANAKLIAAAPELLEELKDLWAKSTNLFGELSTEEINGDPFLLGLSQSIDYAKATIEKAINI